MTEKNFDFFEIMDECEAAVRDGAFILQKWTCDGCKARITASNVNSFCAEGKCEHCGTVTDLVERGCNYASITVVGKSLTARDIEAMIGLAASEKLH